MHDGTAEAMWGMASVQAQNQDGRPHDRLVSPAVPIGRPGVDWRSLELATGAWASRALASPDNTSWTSLDGNLGSVRAFDRDGGALYTLLGQGEGDDDSAHSTHLAKIDVSSGAVLQHAPLNGDVGSSGSILLQLALST